RARAPIVAVAGRGAVDLLAQASGLHRSIRVVAKILSAATDSVREHAAEEEGPIRHGLSADHARPMARRLRKDRYPPRGSPPDTQRNRDRSAQTPRLSKL